MKAHSKAGKPIPKFDWVGLVALLIGVAIPIKLLKGLECFIALCLLILVCFIRHYDWKNVTIALIMIFTLFSPIRVIEDWGVNPVVYGSVTAISFLLIIYSVRVDGWKSIVTALFVVCALLSVRQTMISASEVNTCYVEDNRWTNYYWCEASRTGYQQIESTPIAMHGWCYYCFWYY